MKTKLVSPLDVVYGYLWLEDGREISLDGKTVALVKAIINGVNIISYGEHEIGNDANVFLVGPGGNKTIRGIKNVRELFSE